jgi:hypothetical protein
LPPNCAPRDSFVDGTPRRRDCLFFSYARKTAGGGDLPFYYSPRLIGKRLGKRLKAARGRATGLARSAARKAGRTLGLPKILKG